MNIERYFNKFSFIFIYIIQKKKNNKIHNCSGAKRAVSPPDELSIPLSLFVIFFI